MGHRTGLNRCGKSPSHRDSFPNRPARSESLYRLSYPDHFDTFLYLLLYTIQIYSVLEELYRLCACNSLDGFISSNVRCAALYLFVS